MGTIRSSEKLSRFQTTVSICFFVKPVSRVNQSSTKTSFTSSFGLSETRASFIFHSSFFKFPSLIESFKLSGKRNHSQPSSGFA